MSVPELLRAALLSISAIQQIVGDRIAYGRAPQHWMAPYAVLWMTRIESQGVVNGVQVFKRFYMLMFAIEEYAQAAAVEDVLLEQLDRSISTDVPSGRSWQWTVEELGESLAPAGDGDESAVMLVEATIGAMPL